MTRTVTCADCGETFQPKAKGRLPVRCPDCAVKHRRAFSAQRQATWRAANPERAREHWNKSNRKRLANPEHLAWKREDAMRRAYGIGMAEFEQLLAAQHGACAICGGPSNGPGKRFHVDHCHDSKRIRGLLCGKCNTLIGLADDSPERLRRAAIYLEE